jgi:DNA gyrase inhibitor GyrI
MIDLDVRIVRLGPMRVASVRAVGEAPESDAWGKLRTWAEPRNLLAESELHPVFGFNNPNPSRDRKDYGYELWIKVEPDIAPSAEVQTKDFAGGLYAVTECRLHGDPKGRVPEVWRALWEWTESSEYAWRQDTHELERVKNPRAGEEELVLELYLPIEDA